MMFASGFTVETFRTQSTYVNYEGPPWLEKLASLWFKASINPSTIFRLRFVIRR